MSNEQSTNEESVPTFNERELRQIKSLALKRREQVRTDKRLKWAASVRAMTMVDLDYIIDKCNKGLALFARQNGTDHG